MQWKVAHNQYVIRLNNQEPVIERLKEFSREMSIGNASIQGIGGLECLEYGIFDKEKGKYSKQYHKHFVELIALSGNITWVESEPFIHCHFMGVGNSNNFVGGHLFEAKASITVEMFLNFSNEKIERTYDRHANFKVMQLPNTF